MFFLSTVSKKRKSLTISAPIPCNTAFPPDHPALSKLAVPDELAHRDADTRSAGTLPEERDSEDSSSAESFPSSEDSEGAKDHAANGSADGNVDNAAEQPGSKDDHEEHVPASSPSEDTPTSETPAEEEDEDEPEPERDEAESVIATAECEQETRHGGEEKTEQSEEIEKRPEVTSRCTDTSPPPGFLYKVSALATTRVWRCSSETINNRPEVFHFHLFTSTAAVY